MPESEAQVQNGAKLPQLSAVQLQQRQLAPVKTGLYVRAESGLRLRSRKVRRLTRKMQVAMPWLSPSDLPACRAWAELEILGAHVFADLATKGITTDKGEPRRLLSEYRQLRQTQLSYERDLGMTPAARVSLNVGVSRSRALDKQGIDASPEDVLALEARVLARLDGDGGEH